MKDDEKVELPEFGRFMIEASVVLLSAIALMVAAIWLLV